MKPNNAPSENSNALEELLSSHTGMYARTIRIRNSNPQYQEAGDPAAMHIRKVKEENSTELDLSGLQLTSLPDELFELTSLTTLNISGNQLTEIPEKIGQLIHLNILSANDNPIGTIHEHIEQLQELQTLVLDTCKLSKFPKGILKLQKLKILSLARNEIKWIPVGLKDLSDLSEIDLQDNPIINLPVEFHVTTSVRLNNYYDSMGHLQASEDPHIINFYLTDNEKAAPGSEENGFGWHKDETGKTRTLDNIPCRRISGSDGVYLFNKIYQYQDVMAVLNIATDGFSHLRAHDGTMQIIMPEDIAEMFSCVRQEKFLTKLFILSIKNSENPIDQLMGSHFDMAYLIWDAAEQPYADFIAEFYRILNLGQTIAWAWNKAYLRVKGVNFKLYELNNERSKELSGFRLKEPMSLLEVIAKGILEKSAGDDYQGQFVHALESGKIIFEIVWENNIPLSALQNNKKNEAMNLVRAFAIIYSPPSLENLKLLNALTEVPTLPFIKYVILEGYERIITQLPLSPDDTTEVNYLLEKFKEEQKRQLVEKAEKVRSLLHQNSTKAM